MIRVSMMVSGQFHEIIKCNVYEDRPPILLLNEQPGYGIDVSIDDELPAERQIELADQLMHAAVEFAEAMRDHHGGAT